MRKKRLLTILLLTFATISSSTPFNDPVVDRLCNLFRDNRVSMWEFFSYDIGDTAARPLFAAVYRKLIANAKNIEDVHYSVRGLIRTRSKEDEAFIVGMIGNPKVAPWIQRRLAEKLGQEGVKSAIPKIINLLSNTENDDNKAPIAVALAELGATEATEPILDLLGKNLRPYDQQSILEALEKWESLPESAAPLFLKLAKNEKELAIAASAAVILFRRYGRSDGKDLIENLLQNEKYPLSFSIEPAIRALKEMKDLKALQELRDRGTQQAPSELRKSRAYTEPILALAELGDESAIKTLREMGKLPEVERSVLEYLIKLSDKEATARLLKEAAMPWAKGAASPAVEATLDAISLLKDLPYSDTRRILEQQVRSENDRVRQQSLAVLAKKMVSRDFPLEKLPKQKNAVAESALVTALIRSQPAKIEWPDPQKFAEVCAIPLSREINYQGRKIPEEVQNNLGFGEQASKQRGGMCHVYSAVGLVEDACHRATGKYVDISEAYLVYRHLREVLWKKSTYSLKRHWDDRNPKYFLSGLQDGGMPYDTILKILGGQVCTEKEFPFTASFEKSLRKPFEESQEMLDKDAHEIRSQNLGARKTTEDLRASRRQVEEQIPHTVCKKWDNEVKCRLFGMKEEGFEEGITVKVSDPNLQECIQKLKPPVKKQDLGESELVALVRRGIPVLCLNYISYRESGQSGPHAFLVTGYDFSDDRRLFQIRDTNGANMGEHIQCAQALYFE